MAEENVYEQRAARLAEYFRVMVPRLAERLRGGARTPFTVRLSRAEETVRLLSMTPEEIAQLVVNRTPAEVAALGKRLAAISDKLRQTPDVGGSNGT